jgi:hypothetical protein
MGAALLWVFQLHLSWVLLLPFIGFAFAVNFKSGFATTLKYSLMFVAGCILIGSLLIPAYLQAGTNGIVGGTGENMVLNWKNLGQVLTIFTRYLSLASFELPRFIGANTHDRLDFVSRYIWAVPFIVFATLMGFAQPLWMIVAPFMKRLPMGFKPLLILSAASFILIWLSFLFSVKGPSSHTFYVMFPLIMIYSFYCWEIAFRKNWVKWLAILMLFSGLIFHSALMYDNYHKKSMYRDRNKVEKAISEKDYTLLGERRSYDRNR